MLSCFSNVRLFATAWTVACQAPLSTGFSSKNTGVGCHVLLQGIFLIQGLNLCLLCLLDWQAGSQVVTWATWEAQFLSYPGSTWNFTFSNSILEVIWELKFPWEDRMSVKHWVGKICGCHRNVYSWALSLGVESYSWMEWGFWDSLLNGFPRWFSDKEHACQLRSVPRRSVMSDSVRPHGL